MKETEKSLERKTEQLIRQHAMLQPGDRVLAAVSGGADSMCMLHLLLQLSGKMEFTVAAAHYEHGIRGEEALRDCAFVEEQCGKLGIELRTEHGNVPAFAESSGMGTEEAARMLRYGFLERMRKELCCSRIATAHTMDDNAETVLFHLARGTGSAGLAGIPPVRGTVIRPILGLRRTEIEQYLAERGIPYVQDSSNASDIYARNRIRHTVLPALRQISPEVPEALFRASVLLRRDEECLNGLADCFIGRFGTDGLPAEELLALPPAVSSRVIRRLWPVGLAMEHVDAVLKLLPERERKRLDLPGGSVELDRGKLFFRFTDRTESRDGNQKREQGKKENKKEEKNQTKDKYTDPEAEKEIFLYPGEPVSLRGGEIRITCEECIAGEDVHDLLNTFTLKCGEIYGPLRCTGRKPGDRLRVKGRNCTKTLKALFLEADLTREQRDRCLIFRDERGIVAVEGLAEAERTAPRPGDPAIRITIEREQKAGMKARETAKKKQKMPCNTEK